MGYLLGYDGMERVVQAGNKAPLCLPPSMCLTFPSCFGHLAMHATKHPFSDVVNQLVYQGKHRKHVIDTCMLQNFTIGSVPKCVHISVEPVCKHTSLLVLR